MNQIRMPDRTAGTFQAGALALAVAPVLAVALGAAPTAAVASPLDLFGVGARSPAMAGTGVADAVRYDAAFLNPAGLAEVSGKFLTLGAMSGDLHLYRNDARADTDLLTGLVIGGALRIPLGGAMKDRLGVGFGFHIPTAAVNRTRHPLPGVPVHVLLETRAQTVSLQAAFGVKVTERLELGAGMLALAELRGQIDVTTDASGRFTSFSEQQMLGRLSLVAGARYLLPERNLRLGLTYRGVSRSDYDIVVTNELDEALPVSIPTVKLAGASQYDPLTVALEASWQAGARVTVNGQLAYQRWSAYAQPTTQPVEGKPELPEHGFTDIVIPKLAVEWRPLLGRTQLDVRGGYQFFYSPAPEMDGLLSLLDNHRHILSSGLGMSWPDTSWPVRIELWTQVHVLQPRTHSKDPALFADGEELPFDTMDTSGAILAGGLLMELQL